ncbi:MAG: hypothetical protein M3362_22370 [Acidobacteriota bacterium]|nr:hypothetical protein [Acidobacteriota bacterium]
MQSFINWLLFVVAIASFALLGLSWLEGAIVIWLPRTPQSRFWATFDKLAETLRYVSASEGKLARSRFQTNPERMNDEK